MIGVSMEWNPKQHPSMYYVLDTHHRRCDGDMIILMSPTTETSPKRHCNIWWKQHVDQMILTKYQTIQRIHPLLFYFIFCDQVRYFVDMAISRFDLGNAWPRSQVNQWPRSYVKQITQYIHTAFASCKWVHSFLRHRHFIIWPWNFEVKVLPNSRNIFQLI